MEYVIKNPVKIEAVLWSGQIISETPEWISIALNKHMSEIGAIMRINNQVSGNEIHIMTPDGIMIASPGDYIIRNSVGIIYPCKPDVFELKYDKI